jgi:hypothetical protein
MFPLAGSTTLRVAFFKTPAGLPVYSLQHPPTLPFLFFGGARQDADWNSRAVDCAPPKNKREDLGGRVVL